MKIPLILKLKRKVHKDIAYFQDILVEELYKSFPTAVIHGGTAIWRCYGGNRFSEDIDVYIQKNEDKIREFFDGLKKKGFEIVKRRVKDNSLYSIVKFGGVVIRLEAIFKKVNSILKEYEASEGAFLNVYTLTPEGLIKEKAETYLKRRKIRDLYDIFFLLRYAKHEDVKEVLIKLIKDFKEPTDEGQLRVIIISGPVPESKKIFEYIQKWAK